MIPSKFDKAIEYTLVNEGGFSNVPQDHGGPTNYGITQHDYAQFKGRSVTADEVRHMTLDEAKQIYQAHYWFPAYEKLDAGVATCIFDWGVLHGTTSARKLAQTCANSVSARLDVDGSIGPLSVQAINFISPAAFIRAYSHMVRAYFAGIVAHNPSQIVFLKGWDSRADRMLTLIHT
jgi:lysozyme family protein